MAHSDVTYIYDAATAFRAPGQVALSADTELGGLPLGKLTNVRPSSQRNKLASEEYRVVIVVEEIAMDVDEEYEFLITVGTATSSTLAARVGVYNLGQHVFIFDAATMDKQFEGNTERMFLNLQATGTAPSIKFSAWLV